MSFRLDRKIAIGDVTIAAVVDCNVTSNFGEASVMVVGRKRPVAILLRKARQRSVVSVSGAHMSQQELDDLFPGAWQLFDRQS